MNNSFCHRIIAAAYAVAAIVAGTAFAQAPAAAASSVISDAPPPHIGMPTLKIGGKDDPSVYLQSLDIQVEVTGNIASTRYTMVFKNRTDRELEGMLTFPLPDGRTVTHYALDINGRMRDAVPVEKARATQVFEEIQQRQVDPGLLERVEGNNFRTRIYPFPRNGTRTISIGYEEELSLEDGHLYYRLPMAYVDPIKKFSLKATVWMSELKPLVPASEREIQFDRVGENYVASFSRYNYKASRALIFALPAPTDIPQVVMQPAQGSFYFLASAAPNMTPRKKHWRTDMAVIWDVSLSGSQRDLLREMEALDIIFAEKKNVNVNLYFLNNRLTRSVNKNTRRGDYKVTGGRWGELKKVLEAAVFDGGTDFSQIKLSDIAGNEILFFSDGLSTLSDPDFLSSVGGDNRGNNNRATNINRPIHCIVSSSKADYSVMRLISGKTKGKFVNLNALSSAQLKEELLNETPQFLGVEHGASVREVYPSIATPVQGNFSVAGISDNDRAEVTLLFGYGDKVERRMKIKLEPNRAGRQGNVYRIWTQKKIAELDLNYDKNKSELTELGKQFGIVTRNTSLIVLELIDDYINYNIEPPASEPELLAQYNSRMKTRGEQRQNAERDMLQSAVNAAANLKKWWSTKFEPPKPRYPVPDEARTGAAARSTAQPARSTNSSDSIHRGGKVGSHIVARRNNTGIYVNEIPEAYEEPIASVGTNDILTIIEVKRRHFKVRTSGGMEGFVERGKVNNLPSRDAASRAMAFESAEVIGYLDNPTPIYIVDMDDPTSEVAFPSTLRSNDAGGTGRRGVAGMGSGTSYGSGFGGGGGGVSAGGGDPRARVSRRGVLEIVSGGSSGTDDAAPVIKLTPIKKDADYLKVLTKKAADDYQIYLRLRSDYSNSPDFYFDMAEWFHNLGDRETALRVLTSIADLELENASLYRLLGYRFKEYGEYKLQKFVCKKVIEWRPFEPQGYRDYALALADNGEDQAALDSLYSVLTKTYTTNHTTTVNNRSREMAEIVIMEINRLISKNPKLDISNISKDLISAMPVDIRVVINWNMNNTDIDLHVTDPNGEECYYRKRQTNIGGRISNDNTTGYGPEQFVLRNAVKGKYQVRVNHFSAREFTPDGPATVMAEIYTKYAGGDERRQVVCLQLSKVTTGNRRGNKVTIAEFEF